MFLDKMKKLRKVLLYSVAFLMIGYLSLAWFMLSNKAYAPLLAITTEDSYIIPSAFAEFYLFVTNYNPNTITEGGMPAYNFILAAYDKNNSVAQNKRILSLSQSFINRGADINQEWLSLTPLMGAIVGNDPGVVKHLLVNNVDITLTINAKGKKHHGLDPLEFAKLLGNAGGENREEIIRILSKKT
jgi:hypothetical protein